MKEERFFYVPDAERITELPAEEAQHATRVLRLTEGSTIYLMDGNGTFYKAEVTMTSSKRCAYRIVEKMPQERQWNRYIHIVMAPTKMMERTEWMTEKATEIGIDEMSFLECQFSERRHLRSDRIEKIAVAAMKQSRKAWKPKVNDMQSFRAFIDTPRTGLKCICHCYGEIERKNLKELVTPETDDVTVLIGPEGDFSIEEVRYALEHGYESVSLGSQRLRTETAALVAVMTVHLKG